MVCWGQFRSSKIIGGGGGGGGEGTTLISYSAKFHHVIRYYFQQDMTFSTFNLSYLKFVPPDFCCQVMNHDLETIICYKQGWGRWSQNMDMCVPKANQNETHNLGNARIFFDFAHNLDQYFTNAKGFTVSWNSPLENQVCCHVNIVELVFGSNIDSITGEVKGKSYTP